MLLKLFLKTTHCCSWGRDYHGDTRFNPCGDCRVYNLRPIRGYEVLCPTNLRVGDHRRLTNKEHRFRRSLTVPFDFPFGSQITSAEFQFLEDVIHTTTSRPSR